MEPVIEVVCNCDHNDPLAAKEVLALPVPPYWPPRPPAKTTSGLPLPVYDPPITLKRAVWIGSGVVLFFGSSLIVGTLGP